MVCNLRSGDVLASATAEKPRGRGHFLLSEVVVLIQSCQGCRHRCSVAGRDCSRDALPVKSSSGEPVVSAWYDRLASRLQTGQDDIIFPQRFSLYNRGIFKRLKPVRRAGAR